MLVFVCKVGEWGKPSEWIGRGLLDLFFCFIFFLVFFPYPLT